MADHLRFVSVTALPLADVADIFTRSFEDYFYPMAVTAQLLATRARTEQLDFFHSLVMLVNDEPAGQALLACRDKTAWCGGFGVIKAFRGRGLARQLGQALLEQARLVGANQLSLEVLTRNTAAIEVYQRLGLTAVRNLHLFEWILDETGGTTKQVTQTSPTCSAVLPHTLLQQFTRLHPVKAAWQRDLPALLVRSGLYGLGWKDNVGHEAYVLYSTRDSTARVEGIGATRAEDAVHVLQSLQQQHTKIVSVNEPADSPITAAFLACNFREVDRQHEMMIQL